jgi:hypothetical protein
MAKLIIETYRNPGPPLQKSYTSGSQHVDSSPDNTDQYHSILKSHKFKYNGDDGYRHKENSGRSIIINDNEWSHLHNLKITKGNTPESLDKFLSTY